MQQAQREGGNCHSSLWMGDDLLESRDSPAAGTPSKVRTCFFPARCLQRAGQCGIHYPYWLVSGLPGSASTAHTPTAPFALHPSQARPLTWCPRLPHWTLPHTTAGLLAMSFTCLLSPAVNLFARHNTDMGFNCFP